MGKGTLLKDVATSSSSPLPVSGPTGLIVWKRGYTSNPRTNLNERIAPITFSPGVSLAPSLPVAQFGQESLGPYRAKIDNSLHRSGPEGGCAVVARVVVPLWQGWVRAYQRVQLTGLIGAQIQVRTRFVESEVATLRATELPSS